MRALPASSSTSVHFFLSFAAAIFFGATLLSAPVMAQERAQAVAPSPRRPLITQGVDDAKLKVLKGNTHPLARREFDLGTAPASLPMERMLLVLKRSPEQETSLRKLMDDQQDKNSPNYHKWLTPEQFGARFGPSDTDMLAIAGWLQSHGFQVGTTKGRTVLEFSGSASQVQEAFHTTVHKYIVNGEQHWANESDPSIPAALAPAVSGVFTLHNFLKRPRAQMAKEPLLAQLHPGQTKPDLTFSDGTTHALGPNDFATIYHSPAFTGGPSGVGVTIGVVGRSNLYNSGQDVNDFASVFACCGRFQIILNGPDPGDLGGGEEAEATLDTVWAGSAAPGAQVDLVVSASTNTTDGVDLSEVYIIDNNSADIMTESFGSCELHATSTAAEGVAALAEQAAAQGITYMVSTGDNGAEGCDNQNSVTVASSPVSINLLASTPFNVAVGGTVFDENGSSAYWSTSNNANNGSALSYIPENVWNDSCPASKCGTNANIWAGSGGSSIYFSKPSWQPLGLTGMPDDNARDIPDVSMTSASHDPYLLCLQASCVPDTQGRFFIYFVWGTSAAAPSFAGTMALVDQQMMNTTGTLRQGNANYVLYQLAAAESSSLASCNSSGTTPPAATCVFNDVTVGNNAVPGELNYGLPTAAYQATPGYDLATGLGSVNITNLVNAWAAAAGNFKATTTTLTLKGGTTPITVNHGDVVAVAGNVTANSGTPKGDISLIAAIGSATNQTGVAQFVIGNGGAFSGTTNLLPGGTSYAVRAHYAGDGTYAASDSAPITVTVAPENSTTALTGIDQNNIPIGIGNTTFPFGTIIFIRADVSGVLGIGKPTGSITFTDTFGPIPTSNPQLSPPVQVPNPSPLNSEGNTSIGDGIISFDAGTHSITGSYSGDSTFNASQSSPGSAVNFTIQPGFAGVSGPTDVTINSAGLSGATNVGIIVSSNFTTAISFTCGGLPAEATCSSTPVTGQGPTTVVKANIMVNTTAPHTTMLRSNERRYYYAVLLGSGLPLFGVFVIGGRRRRWNTLLGMVMLAAVLVGVPACGGGGSHHTPDPGTPAGAYTVTVTATAGSLTQRGQFTLTIK